MKFLPIIFCLACLGFALWLGLSATHNGAWISSDSTQYILTAQNIHSGHGFTSFGNDPYRLWPPGYPLAIAGLMWLGIGAEQAARVIPIACYALSIFPLFHLAKMVSKSQTVPYIVCLAYLACAPVLWITTLALTDMPHLLFALITITLLTAYARSKSSKTLALAGAATALAILFRFLGGVLFIAGAVVVIAVNVVSSQTENGIVSVGLRWKNFIKQATLYTVISLAPIVAWSLYRPRGFSPQMISPLHQLWSAIHMTFLDFTSPIPRVLVFLTIAALALILFLMRGWGKYLKSNSVVLLYLLLYPALLVLSTVFEHTEAITTRYIMPIYPFLIIIIVGLVFHALKAKKTMILATCVLLALVGFWGTGALQTYRTALAEGYCTEYTCNNLNAAKWKGSPALLWAKDNIPGNATVYSNCPELLQYSLGRKVYRVPHPADLDEVASFFTDLPEGSYIVCYDDPVRTWLMSPAQIRQASETYDGLVVMAEYPNCVIWDYGK
jgi:4-amino-4-deoxy-L-arabinose transferase-like glycosyltransferase